MLTVWVDSWQMQCCGTAVTVGSRVSWTLDANPDVDFMGSVLGAELAATVSHAEEHHGRLPEDTRPIEATVQAIKAVFCRYAPALGQDSGTQYPVAGSVATHERYRVDGLGS